MTHWYLKIPRFDGRKTLAFNGFVFIAASGCQIWLVAGGSGPGWGDRTWFMLIAAVAGCNIVLRMVTQRPVWWRRLPWYGWDLASGESKTVYHHAAEFVEREDVRRDARHYVQVNGPELPFDADERAS